MNLPTDEEIMNESLEQKHFSDDDRYAWREGVRWMKSRIARYTAAKEDKGVGMKYDKDALEVLNDITVAFWKLCEGTPEDTVLYARAKGAINWLLNPESKKKDNRLKSAKEILMKHLNGALYPQAYEQVYVAMEEYAAQSPSSSITEDKKLVCPNCELEHSNTDCGGYCTASCLQESEGIKQSISPSITEDCIAVGFAEWIAKQGMQPKYISHSIGVRFVDGANNHYSFQELLQLYKQSPEFKALNIGEGKIYWDEEIVRKFASHAITVFNRHNEDTMDTAMKEFKSRPEFK